MNFKQIMNILSGVAVVFCIVLVAANPPLHLMARVWLDTGIECDNITDDFRVLQHEIVTHWLNVKTNEPKQCGCTKSVSKCNSTVPSTQLTLSYQLSSASYDTKKLNKSFGLPTDFPKQKNISYYFTCGELIDFPTTNSGDLECKTFMTKHSGLGTTTNKQSSSSDNPLGHDTTNNKQSSSSANPLGHDTTNNKQSRSSDDSSTQVSATNETSSYGNTSKLTSPANEQSGSSPSIGTIVGASLGALALLAGLAMTYPVLRRLKRQARVGSDNDITPIVPADFGITDAPNSVAPAGV